MAGSAFNPDEPPVEVDWRKDRKRVREGFKDLAYLPRAKCGWNATLAACAYAVRRQISSLADLNLWATMHGLPPSARWEQLGADGLVLWHGTSGSRAEKIREHGLIHKRGVWAASNPMIAHSFTRGRSRLYQAGSAMVVLLISRDEWENRVTREGTSIVRFHASVPRRCVEYILFDDHIEFLGERKARRPRPWGVARFKKQRGRWAPRSRPPVRFDEAQRYDDFEQWLELSVGRILRTLGAASAIEVFSSLYATIDPWDALEHRQIFDALEKLCGPPRWGGGKFKQFALRDR